MSDELGTRAIVEALASGELPLDAEEEKKEAKEAESEDEAPKVEGDEPEAEAEESESKPDEEEEVAAEPEKEAKPAKETAKEPEPAAEVEEEIEIPSVLNAKQRALFRKLPAEGREFVSALVDDANRAVTQTFQERAHIKRAYSEIDSALTPYVPALKSRNIGAGQAISKLLDWWQRFETNPSATLWETAQSYGLDLRRVAAQPYTPVGNVGMPPEMQQRIDRLEQTIQSQQQQEQSRFEQSLESDVNQFRNERDAQGRLLRPDIDSVEDEMIPLVATLRAEDRRSSNGAILQRAYDMVRWSNPEYRAKQLSQQSQPSAKTKQMQVARAKAATVLKKKGSGAAGSTKRVTGDTRAVMTALMNGELSTE